MTAKAAPLNVYWTPDLQSEFEALRENIAKQHFKISKTQLGELALHQFLARYKDDVSQLVLDFGLQPKN
jgi:hypothetical protein